MYGPHYLILALFQHRLKSSSQRDRVREFVTLTQTGEKTAIACLVHHEWKLDQVRKARNLLLQF
jgi:thiamine monophosphate synthase